ncbi:MAG TPA: TonB-dependent receptor [Candidatus Acidoferrum sp.]
MDSILRKSGSSTRLRKAAATTLAFAVTTVAPMFAATILAATTAALLCPAPAAAQSSYTAQLSGVVSDSSGGVIPGAKVTLTDEGTGVTSTLNTDERGIFVFTGIRPSTYTIKASADGLNSQERKGVVLAVSQQANLDFTLTPGSTTETINVTDQAPLLDTGNASLGTDVTNEYVRDIPLINRSFFGLVFLAGGVTETSGSGTQDSYPSGTNFVSNGQRNSTAEVRLDGALTSAPEQGEGGTTNVYYQPSVEIVQEFKVENNSFSSEYGNNGGTVVNIVLKEGTNNYHGSGWWYGQRSALDANDFFNNAGGVPKPDHVRDQYGFSLGGPIKKQKTFFFVDFEKTRQNDPVNLSGTVPTDAQRNGDFSQTFNPDGSLQQIFNPFNCVPVSGNPADGCNRSAVAGNNIATAGLINPIGQALLKLYPEPNQPGDPVTGADNFRTSTLSVAPGYQFDVKIDHHFSDKLRVGVRYSQLHSEFNVPFILGSDEFGDGQTSFTDVHNVGVEMNYTLTPTTLVTSRFSLDRVNSPVHSALPDLSSVGFPASLNVNGFTRMPAINVDSNNDELSMYTQCCTDTNFAHTLYSYSSAVSFIKNRHTFKVGFEQRVFFNNFDQPSDPTGTFHFAQNVTAQAPQSGDSTQGNSFASLLMGYGDSGSLGISPSVANKSMETAFYVQDDWKITPKLTVNLGMRYEWSSPYTNRNNDQQFSDFSGSTGQSVVLLPGQPATPINGTTLFVNQGGLGRSVPTDRNNWAPRVGFAWSFDQKTVIRGGAGVYYGLSPATNFQYTGTAFSTTDPVLFTTDNFATQFATLANPFPLGIGQPQGNKYGALAEWGYDNGNNLGTEEAHNADIFQWNLGVQRLLPAQITIGVDYSANRSTHLPWGGYSSTRNRNFVPSDVLANFVSTMNPSHDPGNNDVSNLLFSPVANPFQPFFQGPTAIFNEPASAYNLPTVPLVNLLRPFPQFDGSFQGLPNFGANSWYHSLQVRFQKRANHYISFEGNYTLSKSTDDSSVGFNAFVGGLNLGNPQQLDRLNLEHAISANDATHRFVLASIIDVPVGRDRWIGRNMNRFVDGVVGGWSISTILTFQSGQPLAIAMAEPRLEDGNQRPNVICPQVSSGIGYHAAASNFLNGTGNASLFNAACFADPGDQTPGNAPRYFSNLRSDGIHNVDLSFSKEFTIREEMKLQLRGEFFNFTNTPRFGFPDLNFGDSTFGDVTSTAPGSTPRIMQFGLRFQF